MIEGFLAGDLSAKSRLIIVPTAWSAKSKHPSTVAQ
jgi:hypothetical protein